MQSNKSFYHLLAMTICMLVPILSWGQIINTCIVNGPQGEYCSWHNNINPLQKAVAPTYRKQGYHTDLPPV